MDIKKDKGARRFLPYYTHNFVAVGLETMQHWERD